MPMGDLARTDEYGFDPMTGVPIDPLAEGGSNVLGGILTATGNVARGLYRDIPRAANWFYEQAKKPEAEAQADVRNVMGGLATQLVTLPERAIGASQSALDTGVYNPAPAVETALTMMGGGVAGTTEKAAGPGLGAGYSSFKLPKPIEEMSSVVRPKNPAAETVINPAKLQGSLLLPLVGDRTAAAAELARVNGYKFENPVALEGGHGYMANNPGMAWAAGKSIAPGIARVAQEGAATGKPVHGVYTAMSETAPDFSVMMSDTLTEMLKHTKQTREGTRLFNETMKAIDPGFPSEQSAKLPDYLREAPGGVRSAFAKAMDTSEMAKHGFPSVAEARVAVTDPRLLNAPTGASGLSIARMDPKGGLGPSGHGTYDTGIRGNYVGGFPTSIPKEIIYPDVVGALSKHADAVAQARVDAGLKPFRPTEDYLMTRTPKGLPRMQEANQKWVDTNSQYLLDKGFTLGSGATDKKGAAAIQGIRAYHSSPHDITPAPGHPLGKFDLAKIGTGEGAQMYGHGIYLAENPAVSGQGGQYWNQFKNRFGGDEAKAMEMLQSSKFDRGQAVEAVQRQIDELQRRINPGGIFDKPHMADAWRRAQEQIAELSAHRDLLASGKPVGPRTYEVNINADPAHLLDWDKKMTAPELEHFASKFDATSPTTRNMLEEWSYQNQKRGFPMPAGEDIVRELKGVGSNAKNFSRTLNEAGIPGIKYLDEGSRISSPGQIDLIRQNIAQREALLAKNPGNPTDVKWLAEYQDMLRRAENPTRNYVIFDPARIRIDKKYGIAGAAAPLGALAATDAYQPRGD